MADRDSPVKEVTKPRLAENGGRYRFTRSAGRHVAAAMALMASVSMSGLASETQTPAYVLGVFPYMSPRQTIQFFGPIATDLGRALGRPVKLETQPSFSDFDHTLAAGNYDIALIQPFDVPEIVVKRGYFPLARLSAPLISQLYVRGDSPYKKISDLRGTTVAMPPVESANARMILRALYDNGLVPGRDLEMRYFNSHDACIQQVWAKNASACGTARPPILVFEQRMHASLRPIYKTPEIPHALFVANPRLSPAERTRLVERMTGWSGTEAGRTMLKELGFPGFVQTTAAEYAPLRNYPSITPAIGGTLRPGTPLELGVYPFLSTRQVITSFAPILPRLGKAAGSAVRLLTSSGFGTFIDGVESGRYDIILVQPFDYPKAVAAGYHPLAAMTTPMQGVFLVLQDSPIHTVAELRGQTISMPPMNSALARLGWDMLKRAGLDPRKDVHIAYRANYENCPRDVLVGNSTACIMDGFDKRTASLESTRTVRPIGKSIQIPGRLFLAQARVPASMRQKLLNEIASWKPGGKGHTLLDSMGLGEFGIVDIPAYANMPKLEEPH